MTRDEVLALGVPESKYRAFQAAYYKDLNELADKKRHNEDADYQTRNAINAMLKLIKKPETLRSVLTFVNDAYFKEV